MSYLLLISYAPVLREECYQLFKELFKNFQSTFFKLVFPEIVENLAKENCIR